ncbi:MAG: DUF4388 domain-containing protein [Acidobacteriota bacterium]
MALEGTLRDFSLADIFQLIGLQRKSGTLTLKGPDDTVAVTFEKGHIVKAESESRRLEDRLGHVLIKTGKVASEALARVLMIQRETGHRVGDILLEEATITEEDLRRALELQVTQVVYRLFRWSSGEFRFAQSSRVEYDRNIFVPIPVENILMEGLRILDEWPLIEKRIRSFDMPFRPTDPARQVIAAGEEDGGQETGLPEDGVEAEKVAVPSAEAIVYALVEKGLVVQDIIDRSDLGEFETCKALFQLLEKGLIQEISHTGVPVPSDKTQSKRRDMAIAVAAILLFGGTVFLGFWMTLQSPGTRLLAPFPLHRVSETLRLSTSQTRLARLEFGIRLYALYRGHYPRQLSDLVEMGLVNGADLLDPWGHSYTYFLSRRSYQVRGVDGSGQPHPDLVLTGPVLHPTDPGRSTGLSPRLSRR